MMSYWQTEKDSGQITEFCKDELDQREILVKSKVRILQEHKIENKEREKDNMESSLCHQNSGFQIDNSDSNAETTTSMKTKNYTEKLIDQAITKAKLAISKNLTLEKQRMVM